MQHSAAQARPAAQIQLAPTPSTPRQLHAAVPSSSRQHSWASSRLFCLLCVQPQINATAHHHYNHAPYLATHSASVHVSCRLDAEPAAHHAWHVPVVRAVLPSITHPPTHRGTPDGAKGTPLHRRAGTPRTSKSACTSNLRQPLS